MAPEEICGILKSEFGEAVEDACLDCGRPYALVSADSWPKIARFLRDDARLGFNLLCCITSLDMLAENKLAAIYDVCRIPFEGKADLLEFVHEFAVRIEVDRDSPSIPSVAEIWPAADWHEREAFDMMGIVFDGHPDLRRILCPDDWVGYPLLKDYEFPVEYQGIPGTTEHELLSPRH